jgi:N6-adenosine-specific RNA methylase IME4
MNDAQLAPVAAAGADGALMDIAGIQLGPRFRRDLGDIAQLAQSIAEIGLLHPIVINPNGQLIAGYRRLEACKKLGWKQVPVRVVDLDNLLRGERDENVQRKDFTPSEAVAIAQALEPLEREAARKRQLTGQPSVESTEGKVQSHSKAPATSENVKEQARTAPPPSAGSKGQSRDKVAAAVGMGWQQLERATAVVQAARQSPEKYGALVAEMDRTGRVNGVYRKLQVQQQAEAIAQEPPPLPDGPFRVIVADPPWAYDKRPHDPGHRGASPYPSMSLEDIKALPIAARAHSDAVLWLWTTNAHLPVAFEVVTAWGFVHKTILTWVKDRIGVGDWLRGQTEHCLLTVRGKPTVVLTNQGTVIHGTCREHSRKPEEFYQLVETLCPGSKLELFARAQRAGWTVHGSETERFAAIGLAGTEA